ncbi:MAG: hypothetical protein APF76_16650 [Desulfitibacter sp. BRH_c19]|nr:MAG: hypothetical protein APF76_16650 [Desulfitibacter sp. BRH_c19]
MRDIRNLLVIKWAIFIVALIGLVGGTIFVFTGRMPEEAKVPEEPKIEMRTDIKVVIDPGHGGKDSGTHDGHGVLEKDITLDIGLRMRDFLHKQGIPVIMTRETDEDLSDIDGRGRHLRDLQGRVKIIDQGTIAISIHINYISDPQENGAVVFYAKGSEQGEVVANKVLQALSSVQHLNHDFPVPRSNLYILSKSQIPIVLVEVGFISNAEDKQKLQDPTYLQTIAEALGKAIID